MGRFWEGFRTGSPAPTKVSRRSAAKAASASASSTTDGLLATTSTRSPCSSQVLAVAGPITAIIVVGCGLPAIPTRLRTVEDEVNTTASNLPVLIASRTGAGGGAARTVRAAPPPAPIREAIKTGGFDAVCFTSSSTVRNLVGIAGKPHARTVVAVIGPATAASAQEFGLRVDVQPETAAVGPLVDALAEFAAARRAEEEGETP